jgi:uncharacterized membrane protein YphA (DoxX/SURF4 family)
MRDAIQSTLATLRAAEWIPVTAARVLLGIFFCISGGTKLFVPAQFSIMEQTMVQSHIPFPHISALFASLVEFACGAGLALGLLTPLCALVLAIDIIVAIATTASTAFRRAAYSPGSMTSCTYRKCCTSSYSSGSSFRASVATASMV